MVEVSGVHGREAPRFHAEQLQRLDCRVRGEKVTVNLVGSGKMFGTTQKLDLAGIAEVESWAAAVREAAPKLR